MSLVNCFKNFRRKRGHKCTIKPKQSATTSGKSPGIVRQLRQPAIVPGEDVTSFERHNKVLQAEFKKSNHNAQVVCELMDRTFAFRRQDILAHTYDLQSLFEKYPFVQECEQVCWHLLNVTVYIYIYIPLE